MIKKNHEQISRTFLIRHLATMPKFTVIVPIYNAEQTLRRCIDSIVAQSYTDWEAILVDDGSTDGSGDICDEYAAKDSRIKVVHQENGGTSCARNAGLSHVNSEWVTFCDADDRAFDTWLENFLSIKNDESDVLIQGFETDKPVRNTVSKTSYGLDFHTNPQEAFCLLFDEITLGYTWNKAFRMSNIRNHNLLFDKRFPFQQDQEFVMRFLLTARYLTSTSKKGYYYCVPNWSEKYKNSAPSIKLIASFFESEITLFKHNTNRKPYFLAQYFQDLCTCIYCSSINLSDIRRFRKQTYKYLQHSDLSPIMRNIIKLDFSGILIKYIVKARA